MSQQERFNSLLEEIVTHVMAHEEWIYKYDRLSLKEVGAYDRVKSLKGREKLDFLYFLLNRVSAQSVEQANRLGEGSYALEKSAIIGVCLTCMLMRTRFEFEDDDLVKVFWLFILTSRKKGQLFFSDWPLVSFARQIKKYVQKNGLSEGLKASLKDVLAQEEMLDQFDKDCFWKPYEPERDKARALLFDVLEGKNMEIPQKNQPIPDKVMSYELGEGAFSDLICKDLDKMELEQRFLWNACFKKLEASTSTKPPKKFFASLETSIEAIGKARYQKMILKWLEKIIQIDVYDNRQVIGEFAGQLYYRPSLIETDNKFLAKGMVWSMVQFSDQKSLQVVAALTEQCFKKIPDVGPALPVVGNAGVYTLANSKGLHGISHLSRLKMRVKHKSSRATIQKSLDQQAKERGLSSVQIEEMSISDCGLVDGQKNIKFKDWELVLVLVGAGTGTGTVQQHWLKPDGKTQKTAPAFIKSSKPLTKKLKEAKKTAKEIAQSALAQSARIESLYFETVSWDKKTFEKHYLNHGLVRSLAQKLVWLIDDDMAALWYDGGWQDVEGKVVVCEKDAEISLWHPIFAKVEEVLGWRRRLAELEIQQPFKQVHREIYLVTDAEVTTGLYSNRMAGHILKQHQFDALAKARYWDYTLCGQFDGGGGYALRKIPAFDIEAQYWVDQPDNGDDDYFSEAGNFSHSGIALYLASDQIRFRKSGGEELGMTEIPPLLFSEIMRDVDLFVAVSSIGNDPQWQDGGRVQGGYNDYWQNYSFGDLGQIAQTRKAVLADILPRLKIRDAVKIIGNFLVVQGKLHSYKIHLGSSNILIEENNKYLCIVPGRGGGMGRSVPFLPFEGDSGLSLVLSKAFLLAEDDKIRDKTILSQL